MKTVDGFIHRHIDGVKVQAVSKDGQAFRIHADNGEQWEIWFVNQNTGELIRGEPAIVGIDGTRNPANLYSTADGQLHRAFAGKQIESIKDIGAELRFTMVGGRSYDVGWVNENGEQVAATPCMRKVDVKIQIPGASVFGDIGYGAQ